MQSIVRTMQKKITTLHYGKEYTYEVFSKNIDAAALRKNIERLNGTLISKSANGFFYKRAEKPCRAYTVADSVQEVLFDPSKYSFNTFWSSGNRLSHQQVKTVIRNYLSAMNIGDVRQLVQQFGIGRVRSELVGMFKEDYKRGYVDIKGMKVPLSGRWDRNPAYLQISKMLPRKG